MERESGMVKWNKFNDAEQEAGLKEIENYVNSDIVVNSDLIAYHLKNIYNQSFFPFEIIRRSEGLDNPGFDGKIHGFLDPYENEFVHDDFMVSIPTTLLFGSFTKPENILLMNILNPEFDEHEEDESYEDMKTRVSKYVYMLKNIITDVDFVIASFPVHIPENERIVDGVECAYDVGLHSIIFTPQGSIGRAVVNRSTKDMYDVFGEKGNQSGVVVRYEVPKGGKTIPHKSIRKKALKEDSAETLIFSNMLETFYELPSFSDEFALNTFVDQIQKNDIKVMATRSIFLEELQDKIVNLPTDGFVLMGETMSKKEWEEIIKVIMAKNNVPDEDVDRLINILNLMEEEE